MSEAKGPIYSFCNQKGGVGKTTTAVNLAAVLGEAGYKVLLIDLDPQGNATSGLGVEKPTIESTSYQLVVENSEVNNLVVVTPHKNVFLIPSNSDVSAAELELFNMQYREFQLKKRLAVFKDEFDFVFIDCPPSLGMLTINALTASDYVMIPLQCEYYALEGLGQLINTYQMVKKNLNPGLEIGGVVMTMADFRTNLTQQVIEEVKLYFGEKVFPGVVPRSVKISEAPSFGKPAVFYDPSNKASKAYRENANEFAKRFGRPKEENGPASADEVKSAVNLNPLDLG